MSSLTNLIVTKTPISTGAWAQYEWDEALAKRFRLTDKFGEPYLLYKAGNGKLWLPRGVCPLGPIDYRINGHDVDYDLILGPKNAEQDRVIMEAYQFLLEGKSGIVQSPTGSGKTFMALALTALMRRRTLIVCTKDDLFDQWIMACEKFLGIPAKDVGRIRGPSCTIGQKITVGMVHSLAADGKYPDSIRKEFSIVHFDEVQRMGADNFMKVAGMFASLWRVGWSATPDRADGKQTAFHAHIGPVRVISTKMPMIPMVYRYRSTWEVPIVYRYDKKIGKKRLMPLPHNPGKVGHVVSNLVLHEDRNQLIAKLAFMAWKNGRKVVLFSDQLEHLENLRGRLLSLGVKSSELGTYVGGISKAEKAAGMTKSMLLCTYGFASEGTDLVPFDCVVIGTPRSDVRQIAGRVLREQDGKQTPIVIDIIDDDSNVFAGYANKRLTFYQTIGAKVTNVS